MIVFVFGPTFCDEVLCEWQRKRGTQNKRAVLKENERGGKSGRLSLLGRGKLVMQPDTLLSHGF